MGKYWNLRILSYVSATMQISGCIILFLVVTVFGVILGNLDEFGTFLAVVALIAIGLLVTLLLGIKQNSVALMSIYVYPISVCIVVSTLSIIFSFVTNYNRTGKASLDLVLNLLTVGCNTIFFIPVFMLYRRLRDPGFRPKIHGKHINVKHIPTYLKKKKKRKQIRDRMNKEHNK